MLFVRYGFVERRKVEIQCGPLGVVQVVKEMRRGDKGVVRRGEVQGSVVGRCARAAHQKGTKARSERTID